MTPEERCGGNWAALGSSFHQQHGRDRAHRRQKRAQCLNPEREARRRECRENGILFLTPLREK